MDNQTERGWWRAALTALAGNLLTGAGSNLVFVVFFSKLEDWSEIFGLFLTVLLPWSLFSALIAAAAAGMAGWMMRDRAWHPRWRRRLFAASLLWGADFLCCRDKVGSKLGFGLAVQYAADLFLPVAAKRLRQGSLKGGKQVFRLPCPAFTAAAVRP